MSIINEKQKTKIIWSINSSSLDFDKTVVSNKYFPINGLRIIYNPNDSEKILSTIPRIRQHQEQTKNIYPILIDVASLPRASITKMTGPNEFKYGEEVTLSTDNQSSCNLILNIQTQQKDQLFVEGKEAFINFGSTILLVESIQKDKIKAKVIQGGEVNIGDEIEVPATKKAPSILDLSYIDIKPFQNLGIDFVILPGVTSGREIAFARKRLSSPSQAAPWIVVKIDTRESYENIDEIITEADGILVPRKELALHLDPALIPMICKELTLKCSDQAKFIFIESEMLGSMARNPTPTRAEVSDIANAVIDGTDAILIPEELNNGRFSYKALELCQSIIEDVESNIKKINWSKSSPNLIGEFDTVAYHAYMTAKRVHAKAVVCITKNGNTALRLSSYRSNLPIIAVTFSQKVCSKLSLVRGVYSIYLDVAPNIDQVLPVVQKMLKDENWLTTGDRIVFATVTISPIANEASNLFTIQTI